MKRVSTVKQSQSPVLLEVQRIVAQHLHVQPKQIKPASTFVELGADNLDILDITMSVENRLSISIDDGQMETAARLKHGQDLASHLTVAEFATVAAASPRQKRLPARARPTTHDHILHEAEVGAYETLSRKRNPAGYELVYAPSLQARTEAMEQQLGRSLTAQETAALKAQAIVIALSPSKARELIRNQASRIRQ